MNETNPKLTANGPQPAAVPPAVRPVCEAGVRERILLASALGLGILAADLLLSVSGNLLGLGVPAGVAAWYAVVLWYVGPDKLRGTGLFFAAIVLLSLTFVLFSNGWFRFWNLGLLPVLLTVHAFRLSGAARTPWYVPSMLWERLRLLSDGLFGRLGAVGAVFRGLTGPAARRVLTAGAGAAVAVPLLLVVAVLLGQADMVFDRLTAELMSYIREHLSAVAARVVLGVFAAPFLFSLLYALGRPKPLEKAPGARTWAVDGIAPAVVLAGLDGLYLFFVGVQSAALFGGEAYLSRMGISCAEYARSGFFRLVLVVALNLAVVFAVLRLTGRTGRGWRAVQVLSTALAALSGVILVSAAWRMTLYVLAYGLSFKRALTYWGMAVMAVLLGAVCVKVWRESFRFFRFAAVTVLAGWLLLNYANVDRIVAEYNVNAYLSGSLERVDLFYLLELSYEALPVPEEKLDGAMRINEGSELTLERCLSLRRENAAVECARWETWSLPAWEWSAGRR